MAARLIARINIGIRREQSASLLRMLEGKLGWTRGKCLLRGSAAGTCGFTPEYVARRPSRFICGELAISVSKISGCNDTIYPVQAVSSILRISEKMPECENSKSSSYALQAFPHDVENSELSRSLDPCIHFPRRTFFS